MGYGLATVASFPPRQTIEWMSSLRKLYLSYCLVQDAPRHIFPSSLRPQDTQLSRNLKQVLCASFSSFCCHCSLLLR